MWGRFLHKRWGVAVLHFKSARAAFDMECKYTGTTVAIGTRHVALVTDVVREADRRGCAVLVAAASGPFLAFGFDLSGLATLDVGSLVTWEAFERSPKLAAVLPGSDEDGGWIGVLLATLRPSYDPATGWLRS